MTEPTYTPPPIWTWNKASGGRFAHINRPIAGPTHDKALPVGVAAIRLPAASQAALFDLDGSRMAAAIIHQILQRLPACLLAHLWTETGPRCIALPELLPHRRLQLLLCDGQAIHLRGHSPAMTL